MNKNKGFIGIGLILAIVLGIAVVGGGAYYVGKSKGENKEVKREENNLPQENQNQDGTTIGSQQSDCNPNSLPSITVISPNGGEVYKVGDKITVKWVSKCINEKEKISVNVSKKGAESSQEGSPYFYTTTNSGIYNWTIPKDINLNQYEVIIGYILSDGRAVYDNSDKLFTINSGTNSEESSLEVFTKQPGAIKSIKSDGTNKWILAVDLLSSNPKWIPGVDSTGEFFINQNTKIRNLNITSSTKIQNCATQYSGYASGFKNDLSSYINYVQDKINKAKTDIGLVGKFGYTSYFDIVGTNITAIYEQCLP